MLIVHAETHLLFLRSIPPATMLSCSSLEWLGAPECCKPSKPEKQTRHSHP